MQREDLPIGKVELTRYIPTSLPFDSQSIHLYKTNEQIALDLWEEYLDTFDENEQEESKLFEMYSYFGNWLRDRIK